jgi:hypothetical protein
MSLSTVQDRSRAFGHALLALMQWDSTQAAIPASAFRLSCEGLPDEAARQMMDEGFRPPGRKDLPRWPIALPIDWQADPFIDRNWRYHLHAWRMLDPLFLAYHATNETSYLEQALEIVRDWHTHHVAHGQSGPFSWYDMSVGLRALRLAHLIDLIRHQRFAQETEALAMLVELWHLHIGDLTTLDKLNRGNHGLFQLDGLLALLHLFPSYGLARIAKKYAASNMMALIRSQFGEDGIHQEHSPEYHFFAVNVICKMLKAPWYDRNEFAFAFDILHSAHLNNEWLLLPNHRIAPVGDSGTGGAIPILSRQEHHCQYGSNSAVSCALSNGYGIVRSRWDVPVERASMLFFMGAFSSSVHKHADDLSFVWFDHGQDILVDSGKYGYDSNKWRQYVLSTRAHNTVEIDGLSYPIKREYAYGSALRRVEAVGDLWLVEAAVDHRLHKVRHQRVVLFKPLEFLIVVDRLVGEREHGFCSWFHFAPKIEVVAGPAGGPALSAALADGRRLLAWHASSAGGVESQLVRGQEIPQIQGWRSCGYKKMEPAWTAGFASRGQDVLLASAFLLGEAEAVATAQLAFPGGGKVQAALGGGTVATELMVQFTADGAELRS